MQANQANHSIREGHFAGNTGNAELNTEIAG
jgi:hypothetical protein